MLSSLYTFLEYYITNEVEEIKSVDLFFDQFEQQLIGESDNRSNPRILIEFNEFEPIQMFGGVQEWVTDVTLHVGIEIYNSMNIENKDKNLTYLTLLDTIYQKLQGLSSYNLPDEIKSTSYKFFNVERSRILFATNNDTIKVTEIGLKIIIEDNSKIQQTATTGTVDTITTTITI